MSKGSCGHGWTSSIGNATSLQANQAMACNFSLVLFLSIFPTAAAANRRRSCGGGRCRLDSKEEPQVPGAAPPLIAPLSPSPSQPRDTPVRSRGARRAQQERSADLGRQTGGWEQGPSEPPPATVLPRMSSTAAVASRPQRRPQRALRRRLFARRRHSAPRRRPCQPRPVGCTRAAAAPARARTLNHRPKTPVRRDSSRLPPPPPPADLQDAVQVEPRLRGAKGQGR
jgi:hypothetical protein